MTSTPASTTPSSGPSPRFFDPARLPERPERILVADDEHLIAMDLALTLGNLGFTVVGPAMDGKAAIEIARTATPDLALFDIRMPEMDGITAARQVFDELVIPVVILSAYSDERNVRAAQSAGVFGYLVKPTPESQLNAAIQVAWERYRQLVAARAENESLKNRLEERKFIEQAKWILVSRQGLSEPDAMRTLQKKSRDARRKLVDIAREVIGEENLPG